MFVWVHVQYREIPPIILSGVSFLTAFITYGRMVLELLMIMVHVTANYCSAIGVPFSAAVSAEVACAALIVAGGELRSAARQE